MQTLAPAVTLSPDEAGRRVVHDVHRGAMAEMHVGADAHMLAVGAHHAVLAEPGIRADQRAPQHRGARPGEDGRSGEIRERAGEG